MWLDSRQFYFNAILEQNFKVIQAEALQLLESGKFQDHPQSDESTVADKKFATSWKRFMIMAAGRPLQVEAVLKTWSLLSKIAELKCQSNPVFGTSFA